MTAPTPEIHHPGQPDGIDEYSTDLPDVARAARRVRAWICEWGDGLIQVTNKRPLYARDLEALTRAVRDGRSTVTAAGLIDKFAAEAELMRDHAVTLNAVAWKIAVALGDVPEGADRVEGNPVEQAGRLIAERDAARAEVDQLRPVVAAARKVVNDAGGKDPWDALATAVDALGPDAPVCPGDPYCRAGHRCPAHRDADGVVERVLLDATDAPLEPADCACGHPEHWHQGGRCEGDVLHCPCKSYAADSGDPR